MSAQAAADPALATIATASAASGMWLSGLSLAWLGVPLPVFLLGFSGAMAARSFLPSVTLPRLIASVVIGALAAAAGTPLVAHYFSMPSNVHIGIAFFLGMFSELFLTWAFKRLPAIADKKIGGAE